MLTANNNSSYLSMAGTILLLLTAFLLFGLIDRPDCRAKALTRPGEIRILPDGEYYNELLSTISRAENEIFVAMFIFKITDSPANRPSKILKKLIKAKKRGVRVRVFLERSVYDKSLTKENRRVAAELRNNDIEVSFDSPRTTTHVKAVVIDKRYVFIGSHNLTDSAMARNNEFSLLVDNRNLAGEVLSYLNSLH